MNIQGVILHTLMSPKPMTAPKSLIRSAILESKRADQHLIIDVDSEIKAAVEQYGIEVHKSPPVEREGQPTEELYLLISENHKVISALQNELSGMILFMPEATEQKTGVGYGQ